MNYKESIEYLEWFLEANKGELSRELRTSIETAIFAMREQIKENLREKLQIYWGRSEWDKLHKI